MLSGNPAPAASSSGARAPPKGLNLAAGARKLLERPLHAARADAKRNSQSRADRASPSASTARTVACRSSAFGASTTTSLVRVGDRAEPCSVASTSASAPSSLRSRPISTRSRTRCDTSARSAPESALDEASIPCHVAGPPFGQCARQGKQHRAGRKRDRRSGGASSCCGRRRYDQRI